ncbi:precorrin-3B synthase [Planomonospora alba]|uniref:Precorrin-3B synthase n=1 Tax=Planomonospora alba TaxID=161354 RepID=A0ABP6MR47_9ACTN
MHQAADGLLARVRLPGGVVSAAQLRELAACAEELGSGVIELTSRANVQVRGLPAAGAGTFAERIAAAGLLPSVTHERVRNIVASPFGDRDAVAALDEALCARPALAELPGRFLFALGDVGLELEADVTCSGGRLLLAGRDAGLDVHPDTAVPLMLDAAEAFLRLRDTEWRIAEIADGPGRIAALLGGEPGGGAEGSGAAGAVRLADGPPERRVGVLHLPGGRTAVQALIPLGRLTPGQARALAAAAESAAEVRLTPWRTAVLPDVAPARAADLAAGLAARGLVTDPGSPWTGVSACTGSPGCAKSLADVRADATRWVLARDAAPDTPVHWAGCARRCGLPRGRVVSMTATGDGYEERQP